MRSTAAWRVPRPLLGRRPTNKFHATPVVLDGVRFASKHEARRYSQLQILVRAGQIRDLELQPRFPCHVQGERIGEWRGDFRYIDCATGGTVIEDAKGVRTPLYRWKRRHIEAEYGITIIEV